VSATQRPDEPKDGPRIDSASGCVMHVFSEFLGALLLLVVALVIAMRETWRFSWLDGAYFALLILWLLARRRAATFSPQGSTGPQDSVGAAEPRWRVALIPIVSVAVWLLANAIQLG